MERISFSLHFLGTWLWEPPQWHCSASYPAEIHGKVTVRDSVSSQCFWTRSCRTVESAVVFLRSFQSWFCLSSQVLTQMPLPEKVSPSVPSQISPSVILYCPITYRLSLLTYFIFLKSCFVGLTCFSYRCASLLSVCPLMLIMQAPLLLLFYLSCIKL